MGQRGQGRLRESENVVQRLSWLWVLCGALLAALSACPSDACTTEAELASEACALAIHSVTPDRAGGTSRIQVTVNGENFVDGTRVLIGRYALVQQNIESNTRITGILPYGLEPGRYDVVIRRGDHQATLAGGFTALVGLAADGVFPIGYDPGALGTVTLYGSGFEPGIKVWFGEHEVTPRVIDQGTLDFLMPAAAAVGPVDLRIQRGEEEVRLEDAFTVGGWVAERSRLGWIRSLSWADSRSILAIHDGGGLFRSGDEGGTWREVQPSAAGCRVLKAHPWTLGTFITTSCGLFVTETGGESWMRVTTSWLQDLVAPRESHVFALKGEDIIHSTDEGKTWSTLSTGHADATGLLVLNTGTEWAPLVVRRQGLFRVRAGVEHEVLPGGVAHFAQSPINPAVAFAQVDRVLYRTRDGGERWDRDAGPAGVTLTSGFKFDPNGCAWLVVGELYRSCNVDVAAPTWERLPGFFPEAEIEVSAEGVVIATTGRVIQRMLPGQTYEEIGVGLPYMSAHALTAEPDAPGHLMAATLDSFLISRDDGRSWSPETLCEPLTPWTLSLESPGAAWSPRVFGVQGGQLIVGEDFGATCRSVALPALSSNVKVVPSRTHPNRLALLSADDGGQQRLHLSEDAGGSWSLVTSFGDLRPLQVESISRGGEAWFCMRRSGGAGVECMSEDGAQRTQMPGPVSQIAVQPMPNGHDRLWIVDAGRLRYSSRFDGPDAFTQVEAPGEHVQHVLILGEEILVVAMHRGPPTPTPDGATFHASWYELHSAMQPEGPWRRIGRMPEDHGQLVGSPSSRTLWFRTDRGVYRAGPALRP